MEDTTNYLTVGYDNDNISGNICFNEDEDNMDTLGNLNDPNGLILVPKRQRSAVSFRHDETDSWGKDIINHKDEFVVQLHNPKLKNALMGRLNTFRKNRELCDVAIFVKEREFLAHKIVLASISPAFLDMFSKNEESFKVPTVGNIKQLRLKPLVNTESAPANQDTEGFKNISYYEFTNCDLESFQAILDYAYTSSFEIMSTKIAELYRTSYALQIRPLVKACAKYLAQNLSISNCISIRRQANFSNDKYLGNMVDLFLSKNFTRVIEECPDFSKLISIKMKIIVNVEQFKKKVFVGNLTECALKYFKDLPKKSERVELILEQLADKVHLVYNDEDQLRDCATLDDQTTFGCTDLVQEYKKTSTKNKSGLGIITEKDSHHQNAHHINGAKIVRSNGSLMENNKFNSNESLNSIASSQSEIEDEIEHKVIAVNQISPKLFVALTILFRRLVVLSIQTAKYDEVIKGKSNDEGLQTPTTLGSSCSKLSTPSDDESSKRIDGEEKDISVSKLFDPNVIPRKPLSVMAGARCSGAVVSLGNKLLIAGGYNNYGCLKEVEAYSIETGKWESLCNMNVPRGRCSGSSIGDKLYVIGGSNGANDLKSCEVYDTIKDEWSNIKELLVPRSQHACCAVEEEGKIYCIGGNDSGKIIKACDRYDCNENEWVSIASINIGRCQSSAIYWKGMVLAIGGGSSNATLDSVESYDPKTNTWKTISSLKTPRRGCALAITASGSLMAIGGHDGNNTLTSVEVLDTLTSQWRPGPSLINPRANTHAVVGSNSTIYCIGGFSGSTFLNTIEVLEDESIGWRSWERNEEDKKAFDDLTDQNKTDDEANHDQEDADATPRAPDTDAD